MDFSKLAISHTVYPFKRRDTRRSRRIDTLRRHLELTKASSSNQIGSISRPGSSRIRTVSDQTLTPPSPPSGSTSFSQNLWRSQYRKSEFRGFTTSEMMKPKGTRLSDLGVPPPVFPTSTASVPNVTSDTSKLAQQAQGYGANVSFAPYAPYFQQSPIPSPNLPPVVTQPTQIPSPSQTNTPRTGAESGLWPEIKSRIVEAGRWVAENPFKTELAIGGVRGLIGTIGALTRGAPIGSALSSSVASSGLANPYVAIPLAVAGGGYLGAKYIYPHIKQKLEPGEVWSDQPMSVQEVEGLLKTKYIPGVQAPELKEDLEEGGGTASNIWSKLKQIGPGLLASPGFGLLGGVFAGGEEQERKQQMYHQALISYMVGRGILPAEEGGTVSLPKELGNYPVGSKEYWETLFRHARDEGYHIDPIIYEVAKQTGYDPGEIPEEELAYWGDVQTKYYQEHPEEAEAAAERGEQVVGTTRAQQALEDAIHQLGLGHGSTKSASLSDYLRVRRITKTAQIGRAVGAAGKAFIEDLAGLIRQRAARMGKELTAGQVERIAMMYRNLGPLGRGGWLLGRTPAQRIDALIKGKPVVSPLARLGRFTIPLAIGAAGLVKWPVIGRPLVNLALMPSEDQAPGWSWGQRYMMATLGTQGGEKLIDYLRQKGIVDLPKITGLSPEMISYLGPGIVSSLANTVTGRGPGIENLLQSPITGGLLTATAVSQFPALKIFGGPTWAYALGGGMLYPSIMRQLTGGGIMGPGIAPYPGAY